MTDFQDRIDAYRSRMDRTSADAYELTELRKEVERLQSELQLVTAPHESVGAVIAALEAEVERLKARGPDPEDVLAVCRVAEYAATRWGTKPDVGRADGPPRAHPRVPGGEAMSDLEKAYEATMLALPHEQGHPIGLHVEALEAEVERKASEIVYLRNTMKAQGVAIKRAHEREDKATAATKHLGRENLRLRRAAADAKHVLTLALQGVGQGVEADEEAPTSTLDRGAELLTDPAKLKLVLRLAERVMPNVQEYGTKDEILAHRDAISHVRDLVEKAAVAKYSPEGVNP